MIRIIKPERSPRVLSVQGAAQTRKDCEAFDGSPDDYRAGTTRFLHNRRIYAATPVKTALLAAHGNKCCYCETKHATAAYLHVEHFRPKNEVRQDADHGETYYPGYYWLVYEWSNLLLACFDCNSVHKGVLFPLSNPENRARSHWDDPEEERPLLVNPAAQDPRQHIRFRNYSPEPRTELGQATIRVLRLDRASLDEARRKRFQEIARCRIIVELVRTGVSPELSVLLQSAQDVMATAILPQERYSSMAIDMIDIPIGEIVELLAGDQPAHEPGTPRG